MPTSLSIPGAGSAVGDRRSHTDSSAARAVQEVERAQFLAVVPTSRLIPGAVQPPNLVVRAPVARQPQRNERRSPSPDCREGLNSPLVACAVGRS